MSSVGRVRQYPISALARGTRCLWLPATIVSLILASGCASMRHYELVGGGVELEKASNFYVLLNAATEKVDYNYLANPLNYASYAKDRVQGDVKLDVPIEILKFLHKRGKNAAVGPVNLAPRVDAILISYEVLPAALVKDCESRDAACRLNAQRAAAALPTPTLSWS